MVKAMAYTVSAREANQQFSDILGRAAQGESVVITRRGQPVAELIKYGAGATAEGNGAAWDRLVSVLEIGLNLGGGTFDRDDLHER
jgi:prevent-host-death family protein